MKNLYESNSDFKGYVDRYCRCYKLSVQEAMTHMIVKMYGKYCREGGAE